MPFRHMTAEWMLLLHHFVTDREGLWPSLGPLHTSAVHSITTCTVTHIMMWIDMCYVKAFYLLQMGCEPFPVHQNPDLALFWQCSAPQHMVVHYYVLQHVSQCKSCSGLGLHWEWMSTQHTNACMLGHHMLWKYVHYQWSNGMQLSSVSPLWSTLFQTSWPVKPNTGRKSARIFPRLPLQRSKVSEYFL